MLDVKTHIQHIHSTVNIEVEVGICSVNTFKVHKIQKGFIKGPVV